MRSGPPKVLAWRAERATSRRRAVVAGLLVAVLSATACRAPRRPDAPPPESAGGRAVAEAAGDDAAGLAALLEAHPLGAEPTRRDLLAVTDERSVHLVQTRRTIAKHLHRTRTERTYVLAGRGTAVIGGRSYPAVPGAAYRIEPGVEHSLHPDEGDVVAAIVIFEPPMPDDSDRMLVE